MALAQQGKDNYWYLVEVFDNPPNRTTTVVGWSDLQKLKGNHKKVTVKEKMEKKR